MRYPLPLKLFVALFGTVCVAVSLVVFRTGAAMRSGYEEYANTAALANMDGLVQRLEDIYSAGHGWAPLVANPQLWTELIGSAEVDGNIVKLGPGITGPGITGPGITGPGIAGPGVTGPVLSPADKGIFVTQPGQPVTIANPDEQYSFVRYFALQDAGRHNLFGVPDSMPHAASRALWVNGERVGWLLFDPGPQEAGLQAGFVADRVRDLYYTAAAALLFSALMAAILSRNILRPIRAIRVAARQLAAGEYSAHIDAPRSDELGDLERDINRLAVALQTAAESQRRWVADTSHELRTPLTIMRAEIEALQDGVYPVTAGALASLQQQVTRLTRLVGDLHELSRADAGALTMRMERVQPGAVLAEVLASFTPLRRARSLALDAPDLAGDTSEVWGDAERLRQVFANVVKNAISYTDPGGQIRACLGLKGNMVTVEIEDSAPGVPVQDRARLFDRFFRAELSRNRQTGGSGLGLAICQAIIRAHGGTITAQQSPLGGVAIAIALPAAGGEA